MEPIPNMTKTKIFEWILDIWILFCQQICSNWLQIKKNTGCLEQTHNNCIVLMVLTGIK